MGGGMPNLGNMDLGALAGMAGKMGGGGGQTVIKKKR